MTLQGVGILRRIPSRSPESEITPRMQRRRRQGRRRPEQAQQRGTRLRRRPRLSPWPLRRMVSAQPLKATPAAAGQTSARCPSRGGLATKTESASRATRACSLRLMGRTPRAKTAAGRQEATLRWIPEARQKECPGSLTSRNLSGVSRGATAGPAGSRLSRQEEAAARSSIVQCLEILPPSRHPLAAARRAAEAPGNPSFRSGAAREVPRGFHRGMTRPTGGRRPTQSQAQGGTRAAVNRGRGSSRRCVQTAWRRAGSGRRSAGRARTRTCQRGWELRTTGAPAPCLITDHTWRLLPSTVLQTEQSHVFHASPPHLRICVSQGGFHHGSPRAWSRRKRQPHGAPSGRSPIAQPFATLRQRIGAGASASGHRRWQVRGGGSCAGAVGTAEPRAKQQSPVAVSRCWARRWGSFGNASVRAVCGHGERLPSIRYLFPCFLHLWTALLHSICAPENASKERIILPPGSSPLCMPSESVYHPPLSCRSLDPLFSLYSTAGRSCSQTDLLSSLQQPAAPRSIMEVFWQ